MTSPLAVSSFQHPSTFVLHQDAICSSSSFSSHPAFPYFALLIIFSLLCLTDHLFLSAFLTRPSWASSLTRPYLSFTPSRTQLHLRHARLPVPFGLLDSTHDIASASLQPIQPIHRLQSRHTGRQTPEVRSGFFHRPDLPSYVDVPCSPPAVVWLLQHPRYFCTL